MHIFKGGRAAYLKFLRNLTPQVIFVTIALLASRRFDGTCCYPENTWDTLVFATFFALWFAAFYANSSTFIEEYLVAIPRINEESRRLHAAGVSGGINYIRALLRFAKRETPSVFWEAMVVFVVVEFGLVAVMIVAMFTATNYVLQFHK